MKLYEISNQFSNLFEQLDAISSYEPSKTNSGLYADDDGNVIIDLEAYKEDMITALFDTLDGIEQELEIKAESIAVHIKELNAEAEQLKAEEKSLKKRRLAKEFQSDKLKEYLICCMNIAGCKKIDRPKALVSVRTNAESVCIADEKAFIGWAMQNNDSLLKYSEPEVKKTEVKNLLKSGEKVPYATLQRLRITFLRCQWLERC